MPLEQIFSQFLTCRKVTTDTRNIEQGAIFFALKGANFDGNLFALKALEQGASMAVVDNPEICAENVVVVDNVLIALQELARMYRRSLGIPVVGLTGTNGKTTTKELITAVLAQRFNVASTKGNLNNHIGVPLTILSIPKDCEIAVVEMGANHPKDIEELVNIAMPTCGLITNVGKAHLEGFGSFDGVKRTKGELYDYLKLHDGRLFLNTDNEHLMEMVGSRGISTYTPYGKAEMGARILPTDLDQPFLQLAFDKGALAGKVIKSHIVGSYNADNMLAAAAIGTFFEVKPSQIIEAIDAYVPSNNRSQLERSAKNLIIVDCYNANPSSMEVAIENFSNFKVNRKVAILGDMLELGEVSLDEHIRIIKRIKQVEGVDRILLVGPEFCRAATDGVVAFANTNELTQYLDKNPVEDSLVLVKGSRGIKLESSLPLL